MVRPKDKITCFELEDKHTDWRCFRLVFITRKARHFHVLLREKVSDLSMISITTYLPDKVNLCPVGDEQPIYKGSFAGFEP